jgi:hypothetical protein
MLTCSLAHLLTCSHAHFLTFSLSHFLTFSLSHFSHFHSFSLPHFLTSPLSHHTTRSANAPPRGCPTFSNVGLSAGNLHARFAARPFRTPYRTTFPCDLFPRPQRELDPRFRDPVSATLARLCRANSRLRDDQFLADAEHIGILQCPTIGVVNHPPLGHVPGIVVAGQRIQRLALGDHVPPATGPRPAEGGW